MSSGFAVEPIFNPDEAVVIEVRDEAPPLIHVGTTPPDPTVSPLWLDIS